MSIPKPLRGMRALFHTGIPQAALAGGLTALAFPATGWWPCAPLGIAIWAASMQSRTPRQASWLGLSYGLGFFVPVLSWSGIYVGAIPWISLAILQALFMLGLGLLGSRLWSAPKTSTAGSLWNALAFSGLFVGQEILRGSIPFGGFPWARLAFSQSESPLGRLAALGGMPLVTFATVLTGTLLHLGWQSLRTRSARSFGWVGGALAIGLTGFLVTLPTAGVPVKVAAIQGNVASPGLNFAAERRAVLANHAQRTLALAQAIDQGSTPQPDLVFWPENSSDVDPFNDAAARATIEAAVQAIKAPVLVGAVLDAPDNKVLNAAIPWTINGPQQPYIKQHPVPFGEYIPHRDFFRRFSSKVDLVQRDFAPGRHSGLLQVGQTTVGVSICFEVAYDELVRVPVQQGARFLVVQTNNATFGRSAESAQQLAMSRLRAMEHGRAVVHISTVGESAIFAPDGTTLSHGALLTAATLSSQIPQRTQLTISDRLEDLPQYLMFGLGLLGVATRVWPRRNKHLTLGPTSPRPSR